MIDRRDALDSPSTAEPGALRRALGPVSAASIVVGGMIGSGIFFKPPAIAKDTGGYLGVILAIWVVCGLVNLCGALAQAELATMFPRSGGTYLFLRAAYGRSIALAWTWAEFWVVRTGAIAALAVAVTMSLRPLFATGGLEATDLQWRWAEKMLAIGVIVLLAALNIAGVAWGGAMQNVTTAVKVTFIAALALLPWFVSAPPASAGVPFWPSDLGEAKLWTGIGAALAAVMWTYDGWGNLTVIAEEVRSPRRTLPLALAGGVTAVIFLYVGATVAFHRALPLDELIASATPAGPILQRWLGGGGEAILYSMLLISVFGALNQNILTGPRVLLAAGRDYRALAALGRVDARTATPAVAIAALSSWACVLVFFGDVGIDAARLASGTRLFDVLTNYCIFGGSIFYLLAVAAVFVLRRTMPAAERPFRTPWYPVVPAVFCAFYVALLASMIIATPRESFAGLAFVTVGLIVALLLGLASRR